MSVRRFAALIVLLSACSSDDEPSALKVTVQKRADWANCFSTLGGDTLEVALLPTTGAAGMGESDLCMLPDESPAQGGVDSLRLVIDYGAIEFTKASAVPLPVVEMIVNGQSKAADWTIVSAGTARRAVFLATLPAPAQRVEGLFFTVKVGDALLRGPLGPFEVMAPVVEVIPICSTPPCLPVAGVGSQQVNIRGVGGTSGQATLSWTLDGVKQETSLSVPVTPESGNPGHLFGTAFVPVPTRKGDWVVSAQVGQFSGSTASIAIQPEELQVEGLCPGADCVPVAGVGTQPLEIRATGSVETQATLTWTINGIRDTSSMSVPLKPEANNPGHLFAAALAPVPITPGEWVVTAQVGQTAASTRTIHVQPATVEVTAVCPRSGCAPVAGVGVQPIEIRASGDAEISATLSSTINGVRQTSSIVVPLKPEPNNPHHVFGTTSAPVPSTEGEWALVAQVAVLAGFSTPVAIRANVVSVRVIGCSDTECERDAAVGSAALEVSAGGMTQGDATITSFLAGIPQSGETVVHLSPAGGAMLAGTGFIPVPIAPDRTQWTLRTQIGTLAPQFTQVTLRRPEIRLSIASCPEQGLCALKAGTSAELTVVAPARIQGGQATITTSVDGGVGTPTTLALADDSSQGVALGTLTIAVPNAVGSNWLVNAKVAGFAAPSVVVNIVSP